MPDLMRQLYNRDSEAIFVNKLLYDNIEVNPCEHRATIVAPAYLKSWKKDKKLDQRIFCFKYIRKNLDSV